MRFYVVSKIRIILGKLNNLCLSMFTCRICYFVPYFTCFKKGLTVILVDKSKTFISLHVFQSICYIKINTYCLIIYTPRSKLITNGDLNSYTYYRFRCCVLFTLSLLPFYVYCHASCLSGLTLHIAILVLCYCDSKQTI